MTSWRGLRHEVAGAWRSLRYDLDRRQARGSDDEETTDLIFPEYSTARPPRRMLAAGGFGLLAVAGAAGTYLAVVSGLGLLIDDPSGGQNALPAAAGGPAAVQDFGGANLPVDEVVPPDGVIGVGKGDGGSGKGEIVIVREGRMGGRITPAGQQAAIEEAGGDPAPAPKPSPTKTRPTFPGPGPTTKSPTPTPTVSTSPSASPSVSPSPSPSPSDSPSPSPSDAGEGGGPADPPEEP